MTKYGLWPNTENCCLPNNLYEILILKPDSFKNASGFFILKID